MRFTWKTKADRRSVLLAAGAAFFLPKPVTPAPPPPSPSAIEWGWDPGIDLDTDGDVFVDSVNGSDSNDGLSVGQAKETIQAALVVCSGNPALRKIKVRAGSYREVVNFGGGLGADGALDGVTIERYADEYVVITGADIFTGWVQCTVDDEDRLGANYASIYKLNVPADTFPEDIYANLFEDGEPLYFCRDWSSGFWPGTELEGLTGLSNNFWFRTVQNFYIADETLVDETDRITGWRIPSVTDNYTQAQIENAIVFSWRDTNTVRDSAVDSFDPATKTIHSITGAKAGSTHRGRMYLGNILPAMAQGQFGWHHENDGTITVYVWPNDPANMAGGIEIMTRIDGVICAAANNVSLRGLDIRQTAGRGIEARTGSVPRSGLDIEHCRVSWCFSKLSEAPIYTNKRSEVRINRTNVDYVPNAFGIGILAGAANLTANDCEVRNCDFIFVNSTPIRTMGLRAGIISHNRMRYVGLGAHGNKLAAYAGCKDLLFNGNFWIDSGGYATMQASSDIYLVANHIPAGLIQNGANTSRCFVDQTNSNDTPPPDYFSLLLCNHFPPNAERNGVVHSSITNGVGVGDNRPKHEALRFIVKGNVHHGHSPTNFNKVEEWDYNLNTASDGTVGPNDIAASITDTWTDPANGDFTPTAEGAIHGSDVNISAEIAHIQSVFGDRVYDLLLDPFGDVIDPENAPRGCFVNRANYATVQNQLLKPVE